MTYEVTKWIKGNPYRYLVRSVREGDRVRQVFVRYLGRADKPSREYWETEPVERRERIRRPVVAVAEAIAPTVAVEAETPTPAEPTPPLVAPEVTIPKGYLVRAETGGAFAPIGGTWATDTIDVAKGYGEQLRFMPEPKNPIYMTYDDMWEKYFPGRSRKDILTKGEFQYLKRQLQAEGYDAWASPALEVKQGKVIGEYKGAKDYWIFEQPKLMKLEEVVIPKAEVTPAPEVTGLKIGDEVIARSPYGYEMVKGKITAIEEGEPLTIGAHAPRITKKYYQIEGEGRYSEELIEPAIRKAEAVTPTAPAVEPILKPEEVKPEAKTVAEPLLVEPVISEPIVKEPEIKEPTAPVTPEVTKGKLPQTKDVTLQQGTLYHNTSLEDAQSILKTGFHVEDTSKLSPSERGFASGNLGDGVYLSPNYSENMNFWGGQSNLEVKPTRPLRLYNLGDKEGAAKIDLEFTDSLKGKGYDGIIVNDPNPHSGGFQVVVFDPSLIKAKSIVEYNPAIQPEQLEKIDISLTEVVIPKAETEVTPVTPEVTKLTTYQGDIVAIGEMVNFGAFGDRGLLVGGTAKEAMVRPIQTKQGVLIGFKDPVNVKDSFRKIHEPLTISKEEQAILTKAQSEVVIPKAEVKPEAKTVAEPLLVEPVISEPLVKELEIKEPTASITPEVTGKLVSRSYRTPVGIVVDYGIQIGDTVYEPRASAVSPLGVSEAKKGWQEVSEAARQNYIPWEKKKGAFGNRARKIADIEKHWDEIIAKGKTSQEQGKEQLASYESYMKRRTEAERQYSLKSSNLSVGMTLEDMATGRKEVITEIVDGGVYARPENEPTQSGGKIGDKGEVKGYRLAIQKVLPTYETKASPEIAKPIEKPIAPAKMTKKGKKLLSANQISDFRVGIDKVVREGDRTFVIDTEGVRKKIEVQSDVITPQFTENRAKLTPEQNLKMIEAIKTTPYLSDEGRAERLVVLKAEETEIAIPKTETGIN